DTQMGDDLALQVLVASAQGVSTHVIAGRFPRHREAFRRRADVECRLPSRLATHPNRQDITGPENVLSVMGHGLDGLLPWSHVERPPRSRGVAGLVANLDLDGYRAFGQRLRRVDRERGGDFRVRCHVPPLDGQPERAWIDAAAPLVVEL